MASQGVFPMLSYEDGVAALEWLERAFGFRERSGSRFMMPDGSLGHAEMETGSGIIMLSTSGKGYEGPKRHRRNCARARAWSRVPWVINGVLVYVKNVNSHYTRAKREGARILSEPESDPPGKRYRVEDLEGQRWMFMQAKR